MHTPWAVNSDLVVPYKPLRGGLNKIQHILRVCLTHPERLLLEPARAKILVVSKLSDSSNAAWEVWRNSTFLGIIVLDRITPNIDARLQFVFFDDELASKVALLREFVRKCFDEFGFERLTFETPELAQPKRKSGSRGGSTEGKLVSFARRRLGFAYEGGNRAGSRSERAYFDGVQWYDVVRLRLLAGEVL